MNKEKTNIFFAFTLFCTEIITFRQKNTKKILIKKKIPRCMRWRVIESNSVLECIGFCFVYYSQYYDKVSSQPLGINDEGEWSALHVEKNFNTKQYVMVLTSLRIY